MPEVALYDATTSNLALPKVCPVFALLVSLADAQPLAEHDLDSGFLFSILFAKHPRGLGRLRVLMQHLCSTFRTSTPFVNKLKVTFCFSSQVLSLFQHFGDVSFQSHQHHPHS